MINYANLFIKTESNNYIRLALDHSGNPRQYIILETPEAKRYAGYTMMNRDIDLVLEAIDQLLDAKQPILIQQSLFFFAVITYAKSYVSNEANRPKLEATEVFKNAEQTLKEEHKHIMDLRNGYVAHAGAELDRAAVVATVVDFGIAVGFDVRCQLSQPFNMSPKLGDFKSLSKFVKSAITIKLERSLRQVMEYAIVLEEEEFEKLVNTPDKDKLYKLVESKTDAPLETKRFEFEKV